jgi:hypothetical protein
MNNQKPKDTKKRPYDISKLTKEVDAAVKRLSFCDCPAYWCDHDLAIAAELEAYARERCLSDDKIKSLENLVNLAKLDEREACAKVAANFDGGTVHHPYDWIAVRDGIRKAILDRGEA